MRETLQQALDALQTDKVWLEYAAPQYVFDRNDQAIAALEAELAKPEPDHGFDRTASHMAGEYVDTAEQEPVIGRRFDPMPPPVASVVDEYSKLLTAKPEQEPEEFVRWSKEKEFFDVAHAPPRKEWVGLMANDIVTIRNNVPDSVVGDNAWCFYFANAIQTILKEKNT